MRYSEHQRLLQETLRDPEYEQFRKETFAAGLRVLRAKHGSRRPRLAFGLALAAAVTFLLAVGFITLQKRPPVSAQKTQPAVPEFSVEVVRSVKDDRLVIQTAAQTQRVEMVETKPLPLVQLNDKDLFAFFANRPVGLMRSGEKVELLILGN